MVWVGTDLYNDPALIPLPWVETSSAR